MLSYAPPPPCLLRSGVSLSGSIKDGGMGAENENENAFSGIFFKKAS